MTIKITVFAIDELYVIQNKDIQPACRVLGKAFHHDPIWIHAIIKLLDRHLILTSMYHLNYFKPPRMSLI